MNKKQKIGLVLSGGGAKGAYQAGVLRALKEYKIDKYINYMSANSIGSLNTLIYLSGGVEKVEETWNNINMDMALTKRSVKKIFSQGGIFSRETLIKSLKENIDFEKVSNSKIEAFIMATPVGTKNKDAKDVFKLNGLKQNKIINVVLASTALPLIFDAVTIDGVKYIDGVFVDNVPVGILKEQGCEIIFVIPLRDYSPAEAYADENTMVIDFLSPYNDYGIKDGTLDFKADRARMRMEHGYNVAKQLIEKLIEEGVIAMTLKQKIRKKWLDFKNRKKPKRKKYYVLSRSEIKHIPETHIIKEVN